MIREIGLYREPLQILDGIANKGYSGMSDYELSFLCGAIKTFKPKKLVEVGIAAGGTTVVILNCLKMLNYDCEMYSVDICEQCYLDISKETGFVAKELLKKSVFDTKHSFILGHTIAGALDQIGGEIDFLILDTMHALPGELLDFLSCYHSLDKNAVVVFHDVAQCQLGIGHIDGAPYEYASLVTLSTVIGEKYFVEDGSRIAGLCNIGAVRLNENTPESIENLFLSLFINWNYIPTHKTLDEYRKRIKEAYDEPYYYIFEKSIESNMFSLYRQGKWAMPLREIKHMFDKAINENKAIYIYGAGEIGRKVKKYIENHLGGWKRILYAMLFPKRMWKWKRIYWNYLKSRIWMMQLLY